MSRRLINKNSIYFNFVPIFPAWWPSLYWWPLLLASAPTMDTRSKGRQVTNCLQVLRTENLDSPTSLMVMEELAEVEGISFWKDPAPGRSTDIMAAPHLLNRFAHHIFSQFPGWRVGWQGRASPTQPWWPMCKREPPSLHGPAQVG